MSTVCFLLAALIGLPGCGAPNGSADANEDGFDHGIKALKMFDFVEAYQALSRIQPDMPKSDPRWMKTTYAFALACWHRPPPDQDKLNQAVGLFRELLAADIPQAWRTRSELSLARIYEVSDFPDDEVELARAREIYEKVQQEYPTGEFGYRATLRLAQTYVQELEPASTEKAIELIQAQIYRDPKSSWASVAWQCLGDLYYRTQQNVSAAFEAYQDAEKLGFANESLTHFYLWTMSNWAVDLGEEEEAVRLRTRIVEDFPRSPYGALSRDYVREYAHRNPEKGVIAPELKTFSP